MELERITNSLGEDKILRMCLRRANNGRLGCLERLFMDFDKADALDGVEIVGMADRKNRQWAFCHIRAPFDRSDEEW